MPGASAATSNHDEVAGMVAAQSPAPCTPVPAQRPPEGSQLAPRFTAHGALWTAAGP